MLESCAKMRESEENEFKRYNRWKEDVSNVLKLKEKVVFHV